MSLKAGWLLMIFATGGNCYRFGGSVGASSHVVAAGSTSAEISQDGKTGDFLVKNRKQNTFTDWSGTAGAGGYAAQAQPHYDPDSKVSGIGGGAAASGYYKSSNNGEIGGSKVESSLKTIKSGFIGSEFQSEADRLSSFGLHAGNMPQNGAPYGSTYAPVYGNSHGPRYDTSQNSKYGHLIN